MESNEQNKENRCIDREQTDTYQREGVCWVKKVKGLGKKLTNTDNSVAIISGEAGSGRLRGVLGQ